MPPIVRPVNVEWLTTSRQERPLNRVPKRERSSSSLATTGQLFSTKAIPFIFTIFKHWMPGLPEQGALIRFGDFWVPHEDCLFG